MRSEVQSNQLDMMNNILESRAVQGKTERMVFRDRVRQQVHDSLRRK